MLTSGCISRRQFITGLLSTGLAASFNLVLRGNSFANVDYLLEDSVRACIPVSPVETLYHLPQPFEVGIIRGNDRLRCALADKTLDIIKSGFSADRFGVPELLPVPKPIAPGMRQYSIFELGDLLVYNSLSVQLAREYESFRPRLDQNVVFSYRVNLENIDLVGGVQSHQAFRQHAIYSDRAIMSEYILKVDIKEFYKSVSLGNLERILSCITRQEIIAEYLMNIVRYWSSTVDSGLLVGSLASSLLAEAVLIPVDQKLLRSGFQYCRFSDDFVFFCSSQNEAHDALGAVTEALGDIGLAINSTKTKIVRKKVGYPADSSEIAGSGNLDTRHGPSGGEQESPLDESDSPPRNNHHRGSERSSLRKVGCDELFLAAMESHSAGAIQQWMRSAVFLRDKRHIQLAARFVAEQPHHTAFFVSAVKTMLRGRTRTDWDRVLGSVSEVLLDDTSHPFSRLKGFVLIRGSAAGASRATAFLQKGEGADDGYLHRLAIECLGTEPVARSIAERYQHSPHGWCRRAALRKLAMAPDKQHSQLGSETDDPITYGLRT